MSRLIDADRLITRMEAMIDHHMIAGDSLYTSRNDLLRVIRNAPDVHASPVVHARWVKDKEGNTRCSNCTERIPFIHCYSDVTYVEWYEEIEDTLYCPHCGKRMDGEC